MSRSLNADAPEEGSTKKLTAENWRTAFTEQLQQSKAGEGKVTITQDKSIDQLVNTPTTS